MSNLKPRQSILNSLITNKKSSVAELTALTNYSRITLSKELDKLLDEQIIQKDGTKYLLCDAATLVVLKMHGTFAEALCFNSEVKMLKRSRMELLHSLPYRDNITFLSTSVQKMFSSSLDSAKNPFLCIVCDKEINVSNIISRKFTVRELRGNLIATRLSYQYPSKSVLYINNADGFSALCFAGSCIGTSYSSDKDTAQKLRGCFDMFHPNVVVVEGIFDESISALCKKENVEFSFLDDMNGLYLDEVQLMLESLCKI